MRKVLNSMPVKLLIGVCIGILLGFIANETMMNVFVTANNILSQIITFSVPLIIIGFIAPSISKLGVNASKMLRAALIIAYVSSVGAALFSMAAGYIIIPGLTLNMQTGSLRELPQVIFELSIPPIMPVMSALVLAVFIGLSSAWVKAQRAIAFLQEFQNMMLKIVTKVIIPLLPFYIATTFSTLTYEGSLTQQLPVFIKVVGIVIVGHFIWLSILYMLAGAYARKNPFEVFKYYGPAYIAAFGTMSSAATLPVALNSASKSDVLRKDVVDFGIPLFSSIHVCGSVLTEVFFVMVVSQMLYGTIPPLGTMLLFCVLLGVFAVGSPGVPGGTVMASLGIIISVLGFTDAGTALLLIIFALQDSFGTACNVASDGALALMLTEFADRHEVQPIPDM